MSQDDKKVWFETNELRGSRLRCLMLTSLSQEEVAMILTSLASPHGTVGPNDEWMPRGFIEPKEAELDKVGHFLSDADRREIMSWWLDNPHSSREKTPTWDIASTCTVKGEKRPGLLLVEAKAHDNELVKDDYSKAGNDSLKKINNALSLVNGELNALNKGTWSLDSGPHYQLSNRFAWSWKIASLGIPVILVYLGFLDADEIKELGKPFRNLQDWRVTLKGYSKGVVPDGVWDDTLHANGTPLHVLIRAMDFSWNVKL